MDITVRGPPSDEMYRNIFDRNEPQGYVLQPQHTTWGLDARSPESEAATTSKRVEGGSPPCGATRHRGSGAAATPAPPPSRAVHSSFRACLRGAPPRPQDHQQPTILPSLQRPPRLLLALRSWPSCGVDCIPPELEPGAGP
eukprot:scaffold7377_cov389-Prasinococcus_capsulatus_cf.AAC.36